MFSKYEKISTDQLEKPPYEKGRVLQTLLVGAVVLATLFAGTYNACRGMQEETFIVQKPEEQSKEPMTKEEIFLKTIEPCLPTKVPKGYEKIEETVVLDVGPMNIYRAIYQKVGEETVIGVQVREIGDSNNPTIYIKDESPVVRHWRNGIQFYGMSNLAEEKIAWSFQNCECMVYGFVEPEVLVEIMETIPGPTWLQENLEQFEITDPVTPQWMPEGYTLISSESQRGQITTTYQLGMEQITLTISNQGQDVPKGERYQAGGISHTIDQGETLTHTHWDIPHWHCHLAGPVTVEEAKKIIDSLYQ